MTTPDATLIRARSKVDFVQLGYPEDVDLQIVVDQASAYITAITARRWDTMPPVLEPIAAQALQIRTEQIAFQAQEEYQEDANDDVIGSLSAGGFSQTKHDPNRRGESKSLNPNPSLERLLWMLLHTTPLTADPLVDEMYDFWRSQLGGVNAPAFAVTEVDWSGSRSLPDFYSQWQRLL